MIFTIFSLVTLFLLSTLFISFKSPISALEPIRNTTFSQQDFINETIIYGTPLNNFSEDLLLYQDENYRVVNSTLIGSQQQVTLQYQYNFSEYPPSSIEKLTLSYAVDSFALPQYSFKWGSGGSGDGQFSNPTGIAINSSGFVYVLDNNNNRVQVFSPEGTYLFKWGSYGSSNGQFYQPNGIAINSSGFVYIADTYNDRIQVFKADGTYLFKWGSSGSGNGQFNTASGIAINSTGFIYVADTGNHRIQVFTLSGTYLFKWGSSGSGNGQFNNPMDIAINSSGFAYVADAFNYRVQVFKADGTYLFKWGSSGSGNGQFNLLFGITFDTMMRVYITDVYNERIQVFKPDGTYLLKWGSYGGGNSQFSDPWGIDVNSSNCIYITEVSNQRVQVFRIPDLNTSIALYNYSSHQWDTFVNVTVTSPSISTWEFIGNFSAYFLNASNLTLQLSLWNTSITPFFLLYLDQLLPVPSTAPPCFIHNPLTDIKPTYQPGPSITHVNISCLVFNTYPGVDTVKLQENLTGSIVNHTMTNETLSKYFYYLNISALTTNTMAYRFWANDTDNEVNWTQWYYLQRDYFGPTITSWSAPLIPEYDETVNIWANITDPNGVSMVQIKWSADNWVTNDTTRTMIYQYQNTWLINTPLPAKAYHTTVRWEIRANDSGNNIKYSYFSYQTQDFTPPSVTELNFPSSVQPYEDFPINITASEPAVASGIDPSNCFIYYRLKSESYAALHSSSITNIGGNIWQGVIPGQGLNETVRWYYVLKDYAGNNATGSIEQFTVVQIVVLVNWSFFTFWVIVLFGFLTLVLLLRNYIPKRYYYLVGLAVLIGITALIWTFLPWWLYQNLSFQQYMQLLGTTGQWWVIVGIVGVFAVGVAALWYFNPAKTSSESVVFF